MRLVIFLIFVFFAEAYIITATKFKEHRDAMPGRVVPDSRQDDEPDEAFVQRRGAVVPSATTKSFPHE